MSHRIVVVTPAGRRRYLDLLAAHVLADRSVCEWQLWDNCRDESDRAHIHALAAADPRIRVVTTSRPDGTNRTINRFYAGCDDPGAFYLKIDDDIVHLSENCPSAIYAAARAEPGRHLWWSPVVVNNAICTWLLAALSVLRVDVALSAQANSPHAWASPRFAEALHRAFLDFTRSGGRIEIPARTVSSSRFSINCIGFFGSDVAALGESFCPPGVDDEEWISAILPARLDRPGRIVGTATAAHYAFYTQESWLAQTDILKAYYRLAGLEPSYGEDPAAPGPLERARWAIEAALGFGRARRYRIAFVDRRSPDPEPVATVRWSALPIDA